MGEGVVCGKRSDPNTQVPRVTLTLVEACWTVSMAGTRQQSSQYPNNTPDARTPFFLSMWIRKVAKLWTREG